MNYVTTTELRTKSSQIVKALQKGAKISLIHRSKVIGVIQPVEEEQKTFDYAAFKKAVTALNLPHLSDEERERRYREHLEKKYGKNLP